MINSRNVKRLRAVFLALVITFATNYAISYAASRSGQTNNGPKIPVLKTPESVQRSGQTNNGPKIPVL